MRAFTLFLCVFLTACGGGGGGNNPPDSPPEPPPDAKPGGFYTGSFVSDVTGEAARVDGLILETGEGVFLSDLGIYTAVFETDEDQVDAEFEAFALFGTTWDGVNAYLNGNLDATVSERAGINGDYTLGGDSGTFTLSYDEDIYENPSSLAQLVGDYGYTVTATGYTVAVSIDSTGGFFGQDTDGCTYQGEFAVVAEAFNAYRVSDMRADCPGVSLTGGDGVAYFATDDQDQEILTFGVQFTQKLAFIDFWFRI